jgi:hypothetical protein
MNNNSLYQLKDNLNTIAGIDPIYPASNNNEGVFHSDGLQASIYKQVNKRKTNSRVNEPYERFIIRRVTPPWLAQRHESTFMNTISARNKDRLPSDGMIRSYEDLIPSNVDGCINDKNAHLNNNITNHRAIGPVTGSHYENIKEKTGMLYNEGVTNILEGFDDGHKKNITTYIPVVFLLTALVLLANVN